MGLLIVNVVIHGERIVGTIVPKYTTVSFTYYIGNATYAYY